MGRRRSGLRQEALGQSSLIFVSEEKTVDPTIPLCYKEAYHGGSKFQDQWSHSLR